MTFRRRGSHCESDNGDVGSVTPLTIREDSLIIVHLIEPIFIAFPLRGRCHEVTDEVESFPIEEVITPLCGYTSSVACGDSFYSRALPTVALKGKPVDFRITF